jgi:hypothetical protein
MPRPASCSAFTPLCIASDGRRESEPQPPAVSANERTRRVLAARAAGHAARILGGPGRFSIPRSLDP